MTEIEKRLEEIEARPRLTQVRSRRDKSDPNGFSSIGIIKICPSGVAEWGKAQAEREAHIFLEEKQELISQLRVVLELERWAHSALDSAGIDRLDGLGKELQIHGRIGRLHSELGTARNTILDRDNEITNLERQSNDLAIRHAALLTQNVQQEEEIAGLEQQVCSLREALDKFTSWYSEPNSFPDKYQSGERAYFQAREVLASVLRCRHEEEKERADMLHNLLRLSQAQYNELLLAVCRKFPDESRHETALRYIREAERKVESGSADKQEV